MQHKFFDKRIARFTKDCDPMFCKKIAENLKRIQLRND